MSQRKLKKRKKVQANGNSRKNALNFLVSATASIPLFGLSTPVFAQHPPESTTTGIQYSYFEDWQAGNKERMSIHAPMAWVDTAIGSNTELEASFVFDSMTGASPIYHDTLSGASGLGIEDKRYAGDITVTQYFEDFSLSLGGAYSTEDDYDSQGINFSTRFWSPDRNTVYMFGANTNYNQITSVNSPLLDETQTDFGAIAGITQILDKDSLIQSNFSVEIEDGYLSDPYKLSDNRPQSRDRYAWLTRYVRYISSTDAALHLDYRFYFDSWRLFSHTMDLSWYQPFGKDDTWMLRPRIRYYSQREANFYSDLDPVDVTDDSIYSADQRLGSYGSFTFGLGLTHDFGGGYLASASYDFAITNSGWVLGTQGSPDIENLYLSYFSINLEKRF